MVNAILALAALLQSATTYDCTLEAPRVIGGPAGQEQTSEIGVPETGPWRFQIIVTEERGAGATAEVRWRENPIQIAGRFPALPTADHALAFAAFSIGPCLFTEDACMTLVHLVDETPQRARIVLTPSALSRFPDGRREPLRILMSGTCTRSEAEE